MTVPEWSEIERKTEFVLPGGIYRPTQCVPDSSIALIVPYRNRESQLRIFLNHIHPFLRSQSLNYRIFVAELDKDMTFNRGVAMNAGFLEAMKIDHFDCIIFHDVDLLPEDTRNNYTCSNMPRHFTRSIDKFNYSLFYQTHFGGAVAITPEQFLLANGYSNMYNGWGCEDDDFYRRVVSKNMTVLRYPEEIARYKMIKHKPDTPKNPERYKLLEEAVSRMAGDGVNNVTYQVIRREIRHLYTWILVTFNSTKT